MKQIALVVPPKNFRDAEYFEPKKIIEQNGIETTTASKVAGEIVGAGGKIATAACRISDILPSEYEGVVFVGGPGTSEILDDTEYIDLAKTFWEAEKLVAAICIAPAILTNAGILKNKSVTGWSGIENDLKVAGANFTGGKVETDNNVITASGPDATKDFGQAIVDYLKNRRPLKNT